MPTQSDRHQKLIRLIVLGDGTQDIDSLATQLDVSVKTIRRDVTALCKLGIDIQERTGPHNRKTYGLSRDALPQLKFTYDEAFALMLCQAAATAFDGTSIGEASQNAFDKIRVALGPLEKRYIDRMLPRVHRTNIGGNYREHDDIINGLTLGIEDNKATFITYHSTSSTEPVTYDIHPYALAEHRGSLYVVGFSCHHNEIRTWKVDRMQAADVTEVPFARPPDFDIAKHFAGAFAIITDHTAEPIKVRVRITGTAVRYVQEKRFHASQQITLNSDQTAEVTFELTSTLEIKSWILSFGASAEVLHPDSLRAEIATDLQQALDSYCEPLVSRKRLP